MQDEPQYTYLVDRNGRGWRLEKLERFSRSCFQAGCKNPGQFEMTRKNGWTMRREKLCLNCFNGRAQEWQLRKIQPFEEE